jgi:predicted lysophospholipase L1 biosynthesis ABC-type transport system permease subunit
MSITFALGASRGRLVRKMLVEFLLLAVVGGVLGIGVTYAGTTRLPRHPNKKGQDGTCPLVVAREATLVLASGPTLRHAGRC